MLEDWLLDVGEEGVSRRWAHICDIVFAADAIIEFGNWVRYPFWPLLRILHDKVIVPTCTLFDDVDGTGPIVIVN